MRLISIIILFISFSIQSCAQMKVESPVFNETIKGLLSGTVSQVDVATLKTRIEEKDIVLLDAREKSEFDVSHLPKAIWVGYNDFKLERLKEVDTTKTVVVYCSVGYRSEKVGEKLEAAGYGNVLNLYGGIFEWVNEDGVLQNTEGSTQKVHGYDAKWALFLQKGEVVIK